MSPRAEHHKHGMQPPSHASTNVMVLSHHAPARTVTVLSPHAPRGMVTVLSPRAPMSRVTVLSPHVPRGMVTVLSPCAPASRAAIPGDCSPHTAAWIWSSTFEQDDDKAPGLCFHTVHKVFLPVSARLQECLEHFSLSAVPGKKYVCMWLLFMLFYLTLGSTLSIT